MNRKYILICDDDRHVTRVVRLVLERQGYEVETAVNGEKAWDSITRRRPDLLITDVKMPVMDGRQLCEQIRTRYSGEDLPVYMVSSAIDPVDASWLQSIGGVTVIEKPISPTLLANLLHQHFRRTDDPAGVVR